MSGGNAASGGLGQPTDAVAMEAMPQSAPETTEEAAKDASETAAAKETTAEQSSTVAPAADAEVSDKPAADSSKVGEKDKVDGDDAPQPPTKERSDSVMAIGPSEDDIKTVTPGGVDAGPVCNITLLLTSGGRHPYKLDSRYLSRRSVTIPEEDEAGNPDPFSISIYTLKELILREWRTDWETKPASPSSIRLIHFGKLLDDKEPLKSECLPRHPQSGHGRLAYRFAEYQFSTESPNVVHMSIRPQDLDEEEPRSGSKALGSGGADGSRSSERCCVIL